MARKRNAPGGAKDDVRPVEPLALRIGDAAKAAAISRSLMYRLISSGAGPRVRGIGARRMILASDLDTWLAAQEVVS
jgi:predicted DNA-binding transcriptional regulator AlpA